MKTLKYVGMVALAFCSIFTALFAPLWCVWAVHESKEWTDFIWPIVIGIGAFGFYAQQAREVWIYRH